MRVMLAFQWVNVTWKWALRGTVRVIQQLYIAGLRRQRYVSIVVVEQAIESYSYGYTGKI